MKKILYSFLALGALVLNSCSKDVCEGISCNGNGTATPSADGKSCACACNVGYTGANCSNADITLLNGKTFTVYESGATASANDTFDVTITSTGNNVLFMNFANTWSANAVIATVTGTKISITGTDPRGQQPATTGASAGYYVKTTTDGDIKFVSGKAEITLTYQVTSPSGNISTLNNKMVQK